MWLGLWCSTVLLLAGPVGAEEPHDVFDQLLAHYATDEGVRYEAWAAEKDDRARLDAYLAELQQIEVSRLDVADALAFWINLYNAATLKLVLDHYPIESLRDLSDEDTTPWQRPLVIVEERSLSLDQIEHDILRAEFGEARIHFALNCAARGCPPLRPEAFRGATIDEQLEKATLDAIHDPAYVKVECRDGDGGIYLSRIFEWYAEDFAKAAGSVHYFLADRREDRLTILRERCELIYSRYDWSLNEAR